MATKQDVEFSLSANVVGTEKIKALRDEVTALAKQGGAVAPEFEQLANELDRLGQEANALTNLSELAKQIEQLGAAQTEAAAASEKLNAEMTQATGTADSFRAAQGTLRSALVDAKTELAAARLRLAEYKLAQKDLIGDTDQYRQTVRLMNEQVLAHRKSIIDLNGELSRAKVATQEAESAEKDAASAYERSKDALTRSAKALGEREQAQRESVQSLRAMGIETENLTQAEASLIDKFRQAAIEQQRLVKLASDQKLAAQEYSTWWSNALYAREQAEKAAGAAAKLAAEQQVKALRDQMAEEDRLTRIVERTRREMADAAQLELKYELEAIKKVEQARTEAAQRQAAAQKAVQDSFSTIGAANVAELRAQITKVNESFATLKQSGTLTGAELQVAMKQASGRVKELELQIREASGALTVMDRVNKVFSSSFGQTFTAFVASNIFMRIITMVGDLGRAFFDSNKQLESFRLALTSVYGSTDIASKQLGFLRKAAADAGISISEISSSFIKFSAAFANAGIPIEQTNELFARLTKASAILGISTEDTGRAITALGQMASKGVVSMEELRQQLGDALPGAFQIAAKGLGITEKQLTALVESGQLAARDFIPAFSDGLKSVSGEVDTMSSRLNDASNVFTVLFQKVGDTGVWAALKGALTGVVEVFRALALTIGVVLQGFENGVASVAVFVAALASGQGLSGAIQAVTDKSAESRQKMIEYASALGYGSEKAKESSDSHASLQRELIKSQIAFAESLKSSEKSASTAKEHAKAVIEEANAVEQAAKAFGTEAQQKEASVTATAMRAEALAQEAEAERATAALMNDMIAKRVALLETEKAQLALQNLSQAQREQVATDRQKEIDDLRKKAAAQNEVAEKARQVAEGARIAAAAAKIEAEANKDNADRVKELTDAYDRELQKLNELKVAKAAGLATDKEIVAQQSRVDQANKLRVDALDDQIARIKALTENKKADLAQSEAIADIRMKELQGIAALGKSIGDENLVRYANVEMLRLQIKMIMLKAEAQKIEAEAEKQIIAIERQKIESTRELTATEKIAFDTRQKLVDVKLKQAKATAESTKAIEGEINATNNSTGSLTGNTKARQDSNKTRQEELALIKEKKKYDDAGYALNTEGQRVGAVGATWLSIYNDLKSYGVSDERAKSIAKEFTDQNGDVPYMNNPGQRAYGADTLSVAVQKAAQKELMNGSSGNNGLNAAGTGSDPAAQPAQPPADQRSTAPTQPSVNMTFSFGSTSTTVAGLTSAQASALKVVVEQLSTQKGTAS